MDELIAFGSEIKSLGKGRVGGYLVRFSDETHPDLTGDFFTKGSDLGIEVGSKIPLYYAHGQDPVIGKKRIGMGEVKSIDDVGVWYEAQIALRNAYENAIAELVGAKKAGYSSGSMSHLVEREAKGEAFFVKRWPIGEGSVTVMPADKDNVVQSLKSVHTPSIKDALAGALTTFDAKLDPNSKTNMHEYEWRDGQLTLSTKDVIDTPAMTYGGQQMAQPTVGNVIRAALDDAITDVITAALSNGVLSDEQYRAMRDGGDAYVDSVLTTLGDTAAMPAPYGLCDALCDDDEDDMYKSAPRRLLDPSREEDRIQFLTEGKADIADAIKAGRKMSAATHKQMGEHLKQIKGGYDGLALLHKGMGTQTPPADTAGKSIDEAARTEMRRAMMSTQMLLNTPTR